MFEQGLREVIEGALFWREGSASKKALRQECALILIEGSQSEGEGSKWKRRSERYRKGKSQALQAFTR